MNNAKKIAYEIFYEEMRQLDEKLYLGKISSSEYSRFSENLINNLEVDLKEIENG